MNGGPEYRTLTEMARPAPGSWRPYGPFLRSWSRLAPGRSEGSARLSAASRDGQFLVSLYQAARGLGPGVSGFHRSLADRKSTRLNSSHANISYAVFCLKKTNA